MESSPNTKTGNEPTEEKSSTKTKKNKKKEKAEKPQISQEDLKNLVNQKLSELKASEATAENEEKKKITKLYKKMGKFLKSIHESKDLTDEEKANSLNDLLKEIVETSIILEEKNLVIKKIYNISKTERDSMASDNVKLSTAKNKMEMACRELQDNSKQIDKTNKQIVEEAKKNRDEIMKTFDKNLDSVKLTEEEAKDYDKENEKLREEIKLKIQDFEERKNKFLEDLKAKDEETKQKNLGLMDKLKQIESNAKEYFFVKQELEQTLKNENEARIQLTFYSQKTGDFELTLEKTCSMLQKFEKEVEKMGSRIKGLESNQKKTDNKADTIDAITINLFQKSEELKVQLESSRKEREAAKLKCQKIQMKIADQNKILEELNKNANLQK